MKKNLSFAGALICVALVRAESTAAATDQPTATTYSETVFAKGRSLFEGGKYREAAAEYDAIALKYTGEERAARIYRVEALYWAALSYIRTYQWPEAKERMEKVLSAGDFDEPLDNGFPSGFRRTIVAYQALMEAATKEKDYKRARELGEKGSKKLADRLASINARNRRRVGPESDLALQTYILWRKPLFDWKIAHPDQVELYYYDGLRKANAARARAAATSSTAQVRNPKLATGTGATSSSTCGGAATTTTKTTVGK
jgi:hypothetical protein